MKTLILTVMFSASVFSLSAGNSEVNCSEQISLEKLIDLSIKDTTGEKNDVFVQYLMGKDGHPSIISVFSDDPEVSGMIEVMVNELDMEVEEAIEIAFDYTLHRNRSF